MSRSTFLGLDPGRADDETRLRRVAGFALHLAMDTMALLRQCSGRSRQRRALLDLDDHLLADIGVSRAAAIREADKRFWQ